MSFQALNWAWETECKGPAKVVLLALADHADERGQCFPSITRLSRRCGLSRRTIERAVALLERDGFIAVSRAGGVSNRYAVIQRPTVASDTDPLASVRPKPASRSRGSSVTESQHPRQADALTTNNQQLTIKEPSVALFSENLPLADKFQPAREVVSVLAQRTGRKIQATPVRLKQIKARLNEVDDDLSGVLATVESKVAEWLNDPQRRRYLTIETLFRPSHFPKYYEARDEIVPGQQLADLETRLKSMPGNPFNCTSDGPRPTESQLAEFRQAQADLKRLKALTPK